MPTKRRRRSRFSQVGRLRDLTFDERFSFLSGHFSPANLDPRRRVRWSTWEEFFRVYEAVRIEMLAERRRWRPYAEHAFEKWQAGLDPAGAEQDYRTEFERWRTQS